MVPATRWCLVLCICICIAALCIHPCTSFTSFGSISHTSQSSQRQSWALSESEASFSDYKEIPDWLLSNCEKMGFKQPTPVQSMALPVRHN
jgi:hypothetical protein